MKLEEIPEIEGKRADLCPRCKAETEPIPVTTNSHIVDLYVCVQCDEVWLTPPI